MNRLLVALALALSACAPAPDSAPPALMRWPDLTGRPSPAATHTIAYGADPLQVVDLWLPAGAGPHPVVVMVHGGCWRTDIAVRTLMNYVAEDLRQHGLAVWNIEYRGVDRPGGGYPGTFADAAAATDALRRAAPQYNLRTDRIAAVGHSAGGHLALWLAGRAKLPASSPLRTADPLRIDAVVSIGGLPDLAVNATAGDAACGADITIAGAASADRPDIFADTSPAALLPLGVRQRIVHGAQDRIAPSWLGRAYATKAAAAGDDVRFIEAPATGHVELVAPDTPAWATVRGLLIASVR
ncbi:MAG: alpha/beta hydrolase [Hyphomonadaceae bacterium]|nr:alpha/beta hydrolase [Hyphomonadaceae bacterium]